jgi:hypothetical protein
MRQKLDQLFDVDTGSRWRIIGVSAIAISITGFAAQSNGSSLHSAQISAILIGVVAFVVQVLWYATHFNLLKRVHNSHTQAMSLLGSGLTVGAVSALAIAAGVSAPIAKVSILNRKLSASLSKPIQSGERSEVTSVITYAMDAKLKLRPDLISSVVKEPIRDWGAYVAALNYTVDWRSADWNNSKMESSKQLGSITKACDPQNQVAMLGTFRLNHGVPSDYENYPSGTVGIRDCRLVLDGSNLKNTVIIYALVEYHGGPLVLDNVRFGEDSILLQDTENSRIFAKTLFESANNAVTLALR